MHAAHELTHICTHLQKETGGHDRYPNCVRYHPSGNHYMTVGADSKIFLFDGKDGKMVKKIEHKDNHKSAITSVAYVPPSLCAHLQAVY